MNVLHEDMGYNTPSSCGPYVLGGSLCVCARVCMCERNLKKLSASKSVRAGVHRRIQKPLSV